MDEHDNAPQAQPTDGVGPTVVDYAGLAPPDAKRPPKSPARPAWWAWRIIIASVLAAVLALVATREWLLLTLLIGGILGFTAMICSGAALSRRAGWQRVSVSRVSGLRLWGALALSLLLLMCHGVTLLTILDNAYYLVLSESGAPAVLRGLGLAVQAYYADLELAPGTLDELTETLHENRHRMVWIFDRPRLAAYSETGPLNSSYAYNAGFYPAQQDPSVVVAFEKSPWTIREIRLLYELGHSVLFADGQVRFVSQGDLKAVLEQDQKRRAELGWPVCDWSKMYP